MIWLGSLIGWDKPIFKLGAQPFLLAELFKKCAESGMLVMGLDILFAEPDRTSPNLIAKEIKKLNPTLASELSKLPSNEFIAFKYMLAFPIIFVCLLSFLYLVKIRVLLISFSLDTRGNCC